MELRVEVVGHLDAEELRQVAVLIERATEADGARPLSEHVMLHLRYGGDAAVRHVLVYDNGAMAGYAHVDPTDTVEGSSAELAVDPAHRRRGIGRRLVAEVLAVTPDGRLRLWAHGDHPAAAKLAESFGMTRTRTLWQLRRSLFSPLPPAVVPPGIVVRTFEPGRDDEAWVALNARAFAGHPEQGAWTLDDLHRRMGEEWFDPEGFFLAERQGPPPGLVGFHWTKVHGGTASHDHGLTPSHPGDGALERPPTDHAHDPIGEVYVVGVDTSERGTGLGRALTLTGLMHLRSLGLPEAMLFVDADNTSALALYEGLGFARWASDVMFGT